MAIHSGVHKLGPDNATLSVHTGRGGAAAKAGHDLVIEVTAWQATLELAEDLANSSIELAATAVVKQTAWGMKPYSALFGALKVKDEVEVKLEAQL